jgi:putative ATPase
MSTHKFTNLRKSTLFEHARLKSEALNAPLATRMRPRVFDEYIGQKHLLDQNRLLKRAIEEDQVPSMILWGPPGVGKTTLARIIASATKMHFISASAVTSGVSELREAIAEAREIRSMKDLGTILFIDEVHRFNKAQQDAILPHVESGTFIFIGATTENPSFEVIPALLSRTRVIKLEPLQDDEISLLLDKALLDKERGLGNQKISLTNEARRLVINFSNGDARKALNCLEIAAKIAEPSSNGVSSIEKVTIEEAFQQKTPAYDKAGDQHYETISAFIKSIRASDPNATIYWLVRMLESGEDPMFIARRLVISASEDIGNADPNALPIAIAAQQALNFIGLPEGAIPLAQASIYLATTYKSNASYLALKNAQNEIQTGKLYPVPLHLRNASTALMQNLGYGKDYRYSHNYEGHFSGQANLPEEIANKKFYQPSDQGYEEVIRKRLANWWENRSPNET